MLLSVPASLGPTALSDDSSMLPSALERLRARQRAVTAADPAIPANIRQPSQSVRVPATLSGWGYKIAAPSISGCSADTFFSLCELLGSGAGAVGEENEGVVGDEDGIVEDEDG